MSEKERERGLLIALEGIDGSGTTTLSRLLAGWLEENGLPAHVTQEPSSGSIGQLIRSALADGRFTPETLALLFAADRLDHLALEIEPQLELGSWVITDRYYYSSIVYQSPNCGLEWVKLLNERAREADLTIVLRVSPETSARRRAGREVQEIFEVPETQAEVARWYESLPMRFPHRRIVVIDAEAPIDQVFRQLLDTCRALLPRFPRQPLALA